MKTALKTIILALNVPTHGQLSKITVQTHCPTIRARLDTRSLNEGVWRIRWPGGLAPTLLPPLGETETDVSTTRRNAPGAGSFRAQRSALDRTGLAARRLARWNDTDRHGEPVQTAQKCRVVAAKHRRSPSLAEKRSVRDPLDRTGRGNRSTGQCFTAYDAHVLVAGFQTVSVSVTCPPTVMATIEAPCAHLRMNEGR